MAAPRGRTSRKGALWLGRHLQNASLREAPHQKAHSGGSGARRMRLSVTSNSRMRFSVECAFSHLRKRGVGSRKSAFCPDGLTEKRSLHRRPHGKAHFGRAPGDVPHGKAHSGWGVTSRMRLYVSLHRRNARKRLGPAMQRETSERGASQTRPRETPRSPRCSAAPTPETRAHIEAGPTPKRSRPRARAPRSAPTPPPHPPCARDLARGWVPGSDRYSSPSPSPPAQACHRPRCAHRPPRPRGRGR